jgi:membrane-associated protein
VLDILRNFLGQLYDVKSLLTWGGYPVLMAIVFAETGLLVGFFLPGDSLLVTAGALVSAGLINPFELPPFVNLLLMTAVLTVMAVVGDAVGYSIGYQTGPRIFTREQSLLFRRDYLLSTQKFYERHGGKTIIIARFMPAVRTFAPVVAGVGRMGYRRFAAFNVIGGSGWVLSMSWLGYFLGQVFDAKRMERVVYLVIFVSVAPLFITALVKWLKGRKAAAAAKGRKEAAAETESASL